MRKISFLFIMLLSVTYTFAFSFDFSQNGINYKILSEGVENTVSVTWNFQYSGEINIPETVNNNNKTYVVTAISDGAFINCYEVRKVTYPNTVTYIGNVAFAGCSKLSSFTINKSVNFIGESAFAFRGLETLTIHPENKHFNWDDEERILYNYNQTEIIFGIKYNVEKLVIKHGVTKIHNSAFSGLSALNEISLPETLKVLGRFAFAFCKELSTLTLPTSLDTIGNNAFESCNGLTDINIPAGVVSIGETAFLNCMKLKSFSVDMENKYFSDENGILYDKSKTNLICCPTYKAGDIKVPETVHSISMSAFYNCKAINSISLPESLISINTGAFAECMFKTIVLPALVSYYGPSLFFNCSNLSDIYM